MTAELLGPEWHLSPEGLKQVSENGTISDRIKLLKNALDFDLKEIGIACPPEELSKDRTGKVVLQVQKVRNIAAPKANEASQAAPRMLKIVLTDGIAYYQAIEISPISCLSRDKTPPGTKVLLNGAKITCGFILIDSNNCTVLGGKVPHLYEKWEVAKSVQSHNRDVAHTDGAPPWVSFGCRIPTAQDLQFKSLDNKNKDQSKESSEFDQLRKDAIAEASTGAIRKVFGGGGVVKQTVQSNYSGNNYNRRPNNPEVNNKDRNSKQMKGKNKLEIEDDKPQKPSERVSLFSFLEDKLPVTETSSSSGNSANSRVTPQTNVPFHSQPNANYNNRPNNSSNNRQRYQQYQQYNYQQNNYGRRENFPRYEDSNFNSQRSQRPVENVTHRTETNVNQRQLPPQNSSSSYGTNAGQKRTQNNPNSFYDSRARQQSRPHNNQDNKQSDNMESVANSMGKMALNNSEFATRSLRQHLNLNGNARRNVGSAGSFPVINKFNSPQPAGEWQWNVGDSCLAKYWEDGRYYDAVVTALTEKTCVIKFTGYGNIEEVLKSDCLPADNGQGDGGSGNVNNLHSQGVKPHSGSLEFRRSANKFNRK